MWLGRQQTITPGHAHAIFPGQSVTSQMQQNCHLSPAASLSFVGPWSPLLFSAFSPRRFSVVLCLPPPHTFPFCSSMTAPVEAPPGLPVDDAKPGVSVRTKGCHQAPQTTHFPLIPHLYHARSRMCPPPRGGNPGQFETRLSADSALHTKPSFCPALCGDTEVQPGEDCECPRAGRVGSWAPSV